jgi:EAL domain-containing protein (putative c-di-GMP-specific phosphodiesterase class I)
MRTQSLPGTTAVAWLEREVPGHEPERIELARLPFTLGRNEACDRQILSSRVSREHAEISKGGGGYRLRDLKSTNGTFVNGQKVSEVVLNDGDLIVIADVQFSFRSSGGEGTRITVTQIMDGAAEEISSEENPATDLIYVVRRSHETLLHRATRNRFQPVIDLADNRCIGYESLARPQIPSEPSTSQQMLAATDCRLTERMSQLHRLVAAEHVASLPSGTLLFVNLQPAEVGADALPASLAGLARLAGGKPVVAEIPDSAVVDIPFFCDFLARLKDLGIGVAYDNFAGSAHQLQAREKLAPTYLKLANVLVRGVDKSTQRQQQIKALAEVAGSIGSQLIAVGVHTENEARMCRELGCRLAQGDHFGRAQTIDWPLERLSAE